MDNYLLFRVTTAAEGCEEVAPDDDENVEIQGGDSELSE